MKRISAVLLFLTGAIIQGSASLALADNSDYLEPSIQSGEVFVIPQGCDVEDWCLVKATPCTLLYDSQPAGLSRTAVKYSVVRRATVRCSNYYGNSEVRTLTGPVEPIYFQSTIRAHLYESRTEAFDLCERYRDDWVSAAPECR